MPDLEKEAMRRVLEHFVETCDKSALVDRLIYLEQTCTQLIEERGKPCPQS